jgi:hypothetical protein
VSDEVRDSGVILAPGAFGISFRVSSQTLRGLCGVFLHQTIR